MIRAVVLLALAACLPARGAAQVMTPAAVRDSARALLVRDVTFLASKDLAGRATGSAGNDSAVAFIARRYIALQIDPGMRTAPCDSTGACAWTYLQTFRTRAPLPAAASVATTVLAHNIVAAIPGTDPALAGEWIVVGAHYDHLGLTGIGARDRRTATDPHLGADDNASGTAALLEIARRLATSPLRRSVMFVHFGAEELGEVGSGIFVANPPVPIDSMIAMVNLDMIGHLGREPLQLFGLWSSVDWRGIVDRAMEADRMRVMAFDDLGPDGAGSDHDQFDRKGVPVIHVFTGTHSTNRTKDDTADILDYAGLLRVADFAERLVRLLGDENSVPRRRR